MERRTFLLGAAATGLLPAIARAHHGWSGFDTAPIYIAGNVLDARWQNPHAELVIAVPPSLALPADLAERTPPAQRSAFDGADILRRAALPRQGGGNWTIQLAPMSRISQWAIPEFGAGASVEVIGYVMRTENAPPYMRAEFLFHDGKIYGLRSAPA